MRTRRGAATVAVVVCCLLASGALANPAKEYEFIQTDRNVALFSNLSETTFTGLRVVFTGEVTLLQTIGIGATLELTSNETGVLVLEGAIPPFAMVEIDWLLVGPRIVTAYWIGGDSLVWVDVHSPYARMWYEVPQGTDEWEDGCVSYVPIDIQFKGNWSKDPDGLPLVHYQWSWSDGLSLEGETVEQRFWSPGWYTVILTVWDAQGLTHSTTDSFYIYRYRCEED